MRKRIQICILIMSLIFPGILGFAAEENSIECLAVEENISENTNTASEEDMILSEDGEIESDEDMTVLGDTLEILNLTEENLVLSIEELEAFEDIVEIPIDRDGAVITEEVVEIHQVNEAGLAANASYSDFRTYGRRRYSGSYGAQLEGYSRKVYNAMADMFLTKKRAETFESTFEQPYVFAADEKYISGNIVWDNEGAEYLAVLNEIKYHVQSAYDAFMNDHPRAFWLAHLTYSWTVSLTRDTAGHYISGEIKGIKITPNEKYEGAASEIDAFDRAVDAVAAEIAAGLPKDADVITIIEEIHDWLCLNVTYEENIYAHTAAGIFLKDRAVVCEGYAKAFDILCDEFGIESVLIIGGALTSDGVYGAHMWNYVNLDGAWYMIDATWDDQSFAALKQYFLAGSSSQGFNAMICNERRLSTDFSGSGSGTQQFVLPVLNETVYNGSVYPGTWHEWETQKIIDIEPTCSKEGSKSYHCLRCDVSKENSKEKIDKKNHTWEKEYTLDIEMTCEQDGQKSYHCGVCDAVNEDSIVIIKSAGHSLGMGMVMIDPTCTQTGLDMYFCDTCNTEIYIEVPKLAHIYGEWKVTKQPGCETTGIRSRFCACGDENTETIAKTGHKWEKEYSLDVETTCEQDGQKSYHCEICDAVNKDSVVIIKSPGHEWVAGAVIKVPTCTAAGQRIYICGKCKVEEYDEIPMAAHSYGEWKVTKQPGCETTGFRSRFCACGDENTETIKADGHKWNRYYSTDRAATCTTYGLKSIHCSDCNAVKPDSYQMVERKEASFTAEELVMKVGQSTDKLKVSGLTGGDYVKSWSPSNKKISVTNTGKITAKKQTKSAAVIITLANDTYGTTRQYRIPVTVQKKDVKTTKITGLDKTITLKKGKKYRLEPVLNPITSTQKVTYKSSKSGVASVSSKGVITAKAAGKTTITVSSGNKKVPVTVYVPKTVTEKISASQNVSVKKGKSVTLKVRLMPANSDQKITFTSKDKKIAVVTQKGKITGKKKGKAEIVVKSGNVTHVCTVTVK